MANTELAEELIFYRYIIDKYIGFFGRDAWLMANYQPVILNRGHIKQLRNIIFTKSRESYYIDECDINPDRVLVRYVCRYCNIVGALSNLTAKEIYITHEYQDCIPRKICNHFGRIITTSRAYIHSNAQYHYLFSNNFELFPKCPNLT